MPHTFTDQLLSNRNKGYNGPKRKRRKVTSSDAWRSVPRVVVSVAAGAGVLINLGIGF